MFALRNLRLTALFVSLLAAMTMVTVDTAEARKGGSFGSRGARTQQSVPQTQTQPNATGPVTYSTTPRPTQQPGAAAAAGQRTGMFGGGIGGMIMGGLIFGGLFGMLAGTGFGGMAGMLGLLVQGVIIFFVVRWLFRRFAQPRTANGAPLQYEAPQQGAQQMGGSYRPTPKADRSNASKRAGRRDEIGVTDADLGAFEKLLGELQDGYSRQDQTALRRITTPEVLDYLGNELRDNEAKGLRNEVFDVKLLEGDVAEAWREADLEYATV
ncbi:MAG TPA: TIM44-like domain-containing protein, partial [Devosia sp.]|nr:TIM44-like domain-containing protein [Devosia sp.]